MHLLEGPDKRHPSNEEKEMIIRKTVHRPVKFWTKVLQPKVLQLELPPLPYIGPYHSDSIFGETKLREESGHPEKKLSSSSHRWLRKRNNRFDRFESGSARSGSVARFESAPDGRKKLNESLALILYNLKILFPLLPFFSLCESTGIQTLDFLLGRFQSYFGQWNASKKRCKVLFYCN